MSAEMDKMELAVTNMTAVSASAVAAFQGVAAQIRDAAGDRAKSLALASELDNRAAELAAAIVENTSVPPTA